MFLLALLASVFMTSSFADPPVKQLKYHHKSSVHHRYPHHEPPKHISAITTFDLCVANREAGSPGSLSINTVNWGIVDNGYEGGYQWVHSTWIAAGGAKFTPEARYASAEQQSIIFNEYEPGHPTAWPNTVPPCLYLK